ncbi:lipid A export permease/ATP-binding protein MsbA [Pseudoalteromonas tunicata]|uniref:Lipid transport protein, flippase n=1 Tax=Pseudoalteromonas tunicata D2 TaxID=87626 RepID=A4CC99_9GAMM|nr:lipid A export permease/ATP-binding protein MsbA [Pseudoalteromonas tunicata]ATC94534.1 ATP-binding cassette, subfamily B, bacterial MsbA [Pseudoalteromonas tunicata]AXT30261.1 lipid A export permease/ATP-binding protein MsbA [Pseudoalteromonas tunicata]EAR27986.1 lipid transport protein, flippase [Pseudoalteromonas tunicata D2]MDP4985470.1 lipid A export permease/ATP-binding protein MsbA [Pseudoalteromonas tunicata]MDP5212164.1 lipid A export permease/ATP-binding protein MsbA [Pseudoaltero
MTPNPSQIYKRLFSYIGEFKFVAVFAVIGMLGYSAMDALFVRLMKPFIDEGLNQQNADVLSAAPYVVIALVLFRGVFNFISSYCLSYVGSQVVTKLRQNLFEHILNLPVAFHDNHSSGNLISKITYDTEQVQQAITKALLVLIREGAYVVFLLFVMFEASWKLSLIFLLVTPFVAIVVSVVSKRFRKISKTIQSAMGDVTRSSEQMLKGHKVIHGFGGQQQEISRFAVINNHNRRQRVKMDSTKALSVSVIQILAASSMAVILAVIAMPSMINSISSGTFVALISSMMLMLRPLKQIANVNSDLQRGVAAAQSVFEILDTELEKDQGTVALTRAKGHIEVKNLTFTYPLKEEAVLHNMSLSIAAGQSVAFVGRSGSGKSTLSNLLPRYYDIADPEAICLDGLPLPDYTLKDLRNQFALVSQQVVLFNDTIRNNICYGQTKPIDDETLIEIAKKAHVWEFVKDLPDGLDTMVGENGVMMSGGQRQRIAIARAIVKDAPILILDEATSALDTESEKLIQLALEDLMKNKTSIVIAHRLSTIEAVDCIYVIDNGRVLEHGNHQTLLAKEGAYASLVKMQVGESM